MDLIMKLPSAPDFFREKDTYLFKYELLRRTLRLDTPNAVCAS